MLLIVHMFETQEHKMNSERLYSEVNFELQLLTQVNSEMAVAEATVVFARDVEQQ